MCRLVTAVLLAGVLLMSMYVPTMSYAASHGGTHGGGGGGHKSVPLNDPGMLTYALVVGISIASVVVMLTGRVPKDP